MPTKQFTLTPAAGKRLIGKAMAAHPSIREALGHRRIVIVAGTTNGYVAEEILESIGLAGEFSRKRFFRGITLPLSKAVTPDGRLPDESGFTGDVILVNGALRKGLTIFDVVDDLEEGDIILKGANALDIQKRRAAILIGHPRAGTIGAAIQAVVGRRVRLILPVGLEKRISGDLDRMALSLNSPENKGPRLFPVPGEVFTELEAISSLTGATAELTAAGGVCGAEGSVWLAVSGDQEQLDAAEALLKTIRKEPPFEL